VIFSPLSNLLFFGEVIWIFFFLYCTTLHLWPNTWVARLGNVYFVEVQGTTPITKHDINFNQDANSTQMFLLLWPNIKHSA